MNLDVEVSKVVFVGDSADSRYTSIRKRQPGHVVESLGKEGGRHTVLP